MLRGTAWSQNFQFSTPAEYISQMPIGSEEWSTIKARLTDMERIVAALRELRTRTALRRPF
jgi:hypothetical protein